MFDAIYLTRFRAMFFVIVIASALGYAHNAMAAGSFAESVETAYQHQRRDRQYYEKTVQPTFFESVMSNCWKIRDSDKARIEFVFLIEKDGGVGKILMGRDGKFADCISSNLKKTKFSAPPFYPYYSQFDFLER
jgi:hypothetical protein